MEALSIYESMTRKHVFHQIGKLRVSIGNVCFARGDYRKAVKYYRMAFDKVSLNGAFVCLQISKKTQHSVRQRCIILSKQCPLMQFVAEAGLGNVNRP